MSVAAAVADPILDDEEDIGQATNGTGPQLDLIKSELGIGDDQVPWWAVGVLDLPAGSPLDRARVIMENGRDLKRWMEHHRFWRVVDPEERLITLLRRFADVVSMARERVDPDDPGAWAKRAYDQRDDGGWERERVRAACLRSPRAACEFFGLVDDMGKPIRLKAFHVLVINALRRSEVAAILLPAEFGKSWNSSILVPLMDWAEWPNAQEGRVYASEVFTEKWTKRLMGIVQHNERVQQIFPWIRRPRKGDRSFGVWSKEGFCIGGRQDRDFSFQPLTVKSFTVGARYHRLGADDLVNRGNCASDTWQNQFFEYIHDSFLTMCSAIGPTDSPYGTRWGTGYLLGTVFEAMDVNYRMWRTWRQAHDAGDLNATCLRFDIYPRGTKSKICGEVLWPEERDLAWVQRQERKVGMRAFRLRYRNLVDHVAKEGFAEEVVRSCLQDEWSWGVPPEEMPLVVGFDPGRGRPGRRSRNPAFAVYGARNRVGPPPRGGPLRDPRHPRDWAGAWNPAHQIDRDPIHCHLIQWGRMENTPFPRQCERLVDLARAFNCPVVVEDNNIQTAYEDQIRVIAPDVRVFSHTTRENKRDPDQGVESLLPLMESGFLHIHAGGAPPEEIEALVDEFSSWKKGGRYDDIVMALWIARYQHQLRVVPYLTPEPPTRQMPWYAQRLLPRQSWRGRTGSSSWR